jgi:hypothetical protein
LAKKKELRAGEKVDTGCIVDSLKMSIVEFIGGIKTPFRWRVCSTPREALEPFTYNLYLSADSLTNVLQHQKQEEIAAVKEAY